MRLVHALPAVALVACAAERRAQVEEARAAEAPPSPARIQTSARLPPALTPKEIIERVERSSTKVIIKDHKGAYLDQELQRNARAMWPAGPGAYNYPRLERGPGGPRVVETNVSPEIAALFEQAEPAYAAERYPEAERS